MLFLNWLLKHKVSWLYFSQVLRRAGDYVTGLFAFGKLFFFPQISLSAQTPSFFCHRLHGFSQIKAKKSAFSEKSAGHICGNPRNLRGNNFAEGEPSVLIRAIRGKILPKAKNHYLCSSSLIIARISGVLLQ
jgi:hypothetical protein